MARILMLCHDQFLDRRVLAQAGSLIGRGHQVVLLALALGPEGAAETTPEGVELIRIGLKEIVPANAIYRRYQQRQHWLMSQVYQAPCNRWPARAATFERLFQRLSQAHWSYYRLDLLRYYRNHRMHDPLPFTGAFLGAGSAHRADLVQVHDLPALEAGVALARQWDCPLVYDAHELYPEQRSFSRRQREICAEAEARLVPRASLVFTVNGSIAGEMHKRYGIPTPTVLLNALDPGPGFRADAGYDHLRQDLGLLPEHRILLFQGGFSPHRNLELLVRAMARVKTTDVVLVLMGFGDHGVRLQQIARELCLLESRVFFREAVPQNILLEYSASADVGIIPYPHVDLNSYYCTPNKLFEFIQAGLPMLANDSPELRRFVADTGFGMTAPMTDAVAMASAIDAVFSRSDRLEIWRQRLREHRSDYVWARQERVYLDAMEPLFVASRNPAATA